MARTKLLVFLIIVCAVKCLAKSYHIRIEDLAEYLKKTSQLGPSLKNLDDDYESDEFVSDYAWEESGKFEGDMILNERQRSLILEEVSEVHTRNGIRNGSRKWPNNEVIFHIKVADFTNKQLQVIENVMKDLTSTTCIKFRPYRKGDRDVVIIQGGKKGCFSHVGYQRGRQVVNLSGRHRVGKGCFKRGTVVHELLHALGFYHMHSSPERDDYVDIIWDNINGNKTKNFIKYNLNRVSTFGVGYDYKSCMHYNRRAFSTNGQDTIVPKQYGVTIGQRKALSEKDRQKVIKMYCDASEAENVQVEEIAPKNNTIFSQILDSIYNMFS